MKRYFRYAAFLGLAAIALLLLTSYLADHSRHSGETPNVADFQPEVPPTASTGDEELALKSAKTHDSSPQTASSASSAGSESAQQEDKVAESNDEPPADPSAAEKVNSLLKSPDLKQAYTAFRAIQKCKHAPLGDEELQRHLEGYERMRNDPDHGMDWRPHLEGAEERALQLRNECGELFRVRERIWSGELFNRAADGDEFARFLYAMWAPRERDAVAVPMEALLSYESTSLEFTLQNLEEGHPLGMLAFGFSYLSGHYFTPRRHGLGTAFLIAAALCANGEFGLQPMLDERFEQIEQYQYSGHALTTLELLEAGTRLHDTHCASSISRSQD